MIQKLYPARQGSRVKTDNAAKEAHLIFWRRVAGAMP